MKPKSNSKGRKAGKPVRILFLLIAGAVTSFAYPPLSLWPLAWICMIPLLLILRKARLRDAALYGFAFGIGFFGGMASWSLIFGFFSWIMLTLIWAPVVAVFGIGAAVIYRSRSFWLQLLAVPALWTAIEWLRSLGSYGCTWGMLAQTQAENLPAAQLAAWTGSWGLTFVLVLFNAAFAVEKHRKPAVIATAVIVIALHAGGSLCLRHQISDEGKIKVALIQGSIPPRIFGLDEENRVARIREHQIQCIRTYHKLTMKAIEKQPDLIVWPESVVPGDVIGDTAVRRWVANVARATNAHMLVGSPRNFKDGKDGLVRQMNGAHLFSPEGKLQGSYFKVQLVPFAEFIPHRKILQLIGRQPFRETDVIAAREHKLIPSIFGKIGTVICFESVFPGITRRETKDGAVILFVLTNDGWFKRTSAAAQHYNHSILRAIENRRYVVRNGCSGISCIVDPYGRVTDKLGIWEQGVLFGEVQTSDYLTFYSRFGDWFAYFSVVLATLGLLMGVIQKD